jgi:hypothetical protein
MASTRSWRLWERSWQGSSAPSGTAALSTEAQQHPGLHLWLDRSRHRLALRFCFLAEPQKRGAAREPRWVRCQPSRRALLAWSAGGSIPHGTVTGMSRTLASTSYVLLPRTDRPVTGHGKHPNRVPKSTRLGRPRRGRPGQALSKPGASRSCWSCASTQAQLRSGHPSYRHRYLDPG